MATAVPTTELLAVNEMLTAIGTSPVSTLEVPGLSDAAIALDTLRAISKEVQTHGWWFNRSYAVSLAPASNQITVPATMLSVNPTRGTDAVPAEVTRFCTRDNKLFNMNTNSYTFAAPVKADVTYELEFENLPESVRRYVTVRAARIFQTKVLGDEQLGVFTSQNEQEAWSILEGDEGQNNPHSMMFMQRVRARARQSRPDPVTEQPRQRRGE